MVNDDDDDDRKGTQAMTKAMMISPPPKNGGNFLSEDYTQTSPSSSHTGLSNNKNWVPISNAYLSLSLLSSLDYLPFFCPLFG